MGRGHACNLLIVTLEFIFQDRPANDKLAYECHYVSATSARWTFTNGFNPAFVFSVLLSRNSKE